MVSVNHHSDALQAQLKRGAAIDTGLVLIAVGLRANTAWLIDTGLACDKGVLVNNLLQTSDPHVYALGDVAQYASANHRLLPYVMPIMAEARALGATLAGTPTEVVFPVMPVAVKTSALPLLLAARQRRCLASCRRRCLETHDGGRAVERLCACRQSNRTTRQSLAMAFPGLNTKAPADKATVAQTPSLATRSS